MWRLIFLILLVFAKARSVSAEDNYEPYIANLILGNTSLSQEFVIYSSPDVNDFYYIPLLEFAEQMMIPLKRENNIIKGWVLNENNKVVIDIKNLTVQISDKSILLNKSDIIEIYDKIYISFEGIEKILPLELKFNSLKQILIIETKEPFPIEKQIARQEMIQSFHKDKSGNRLFNNTHLELQNYQEFSLPNLDFNYGKIFNSTGSQPSQDLLTFASSSHLLKSILNVNGTTTNGILTNIQLSLRRNDFIKRPFEHALHPKQYWMGDIITNPTNLVSNTSSGMGFFVSNIPPGWKIDFNNLNITGYAIPGWSIEIYVNNNLFDFATVGQKGIYSFEQIPLNTGLNTVKLVFYGPYGQRRESIEKISLDSSLLQKGKTVYEVSAVEGGRNMIQNDAIRETNKVNEGDRYYANVRYGIGQKTSISVGATSYNKDLETFNTGIKKVHQYLNTSVTSGIQSTMINLDVASDVQNNQSAYGLSINTPVFKDSNLFIYSQYYTSGFTSEVRPQATSFSTKTNTQARFTTGTNIFGKYLSHILTTNITSLENGNVSSIYSLRNSISLFRFMNVSNVLNINDSLNGKVADGNVNVTMRKNALFLVRGSLGYTPFYGTSAFTSGNVNVNINRIKYGINLNFFKDLTQNTDSYDVGVNHNSGYLITSVSVGYSQSTKTRVSFNVSSGLAFSGVTPKIVPYNAATTGAVEVDTFLDENLNGKRDFDEKAVSGIGVTIGGIEQDGVTNDKGKMIITNLPVGSEVLFDVNTAAMPDITMQGGKTAKRRLVLLSGATHKIDLPIIHVTEIDGILTVQMGDEKIPIGNTTVKLIDKENHVVNETRTSSDGYYIFTQVPHGTYKVKVDEKDVERYKNYLIEHHE